MVNNLLKEATRFHKLSQDPLAPVKAAVEGAVSNFPDTTVKTVSLIGNDVKVDVDISNSAAQGTTRETLEAYIKPAVQKINPSFQVSVSVSMSSETTLPKSASLRKRFANLHKLSQCAPGDPLCDDLNAGLPPDEAKKPVKPAPKPTPAPAPKPDVNKVEDASPKNAAQSAIIAALQGSGLGMRGFTWQGESKRILVEVGVPRAQKISTQKVNDYLTQKITSIAPGFTVLTTLSTY